MKTLPNGTQVEMFTIGSLAQALNRPIITVRHWIKKGYIPASPYRLPTTTDRNGDERKGRRLYTRPMIEAVVAMKTVVEKFKLNNNLDIVNMALIHDGDSDSINCYWTSSGVSYFNIKRTNVVMRDKETKTEYRLNTEENAYDNALRIATFDWFRKTTGVKIVGFFIVGAGRSAKGNITRRYYYGDGQCIWDKFPKNANYYQRQEKTDELFSVLKENKFLESKNPGYDSMYLIPGDKDLSIEHDELSVQGTVTASKLKNAFMKMNKKKQVSRVLVNRFIGQIAV